MVAKNNTSSRQGRNKVINNLIIAILWMFAFTVSFVLAYQRYHAAVLQPPGVDFNYVLHAAKNVAAGLSPYSVPQYVYPPTLALVVAVFSHANLYHVWHVWVALMILAPILGVSLFVFTIARKRLSSWLWPVMFGLFSRTILLSHYYPMSRDLFLGQSDALIFPFLLLAFIAAGWTAPATRGVLIGVAGLFKGWPGGIGLSLLQRNVKKRWRAIAVLALTLILAPLSALILWGRTGLQGFVKNVFDARSQHIINDSVLGAVKLLFSHSGMARPLLVSEVIEMLVAGILLGWVIWLLIKVLRTSSDPVMCILHVTFCILLLLPVSHRQYAIYVLPILWLWVMRLLENRGKDKTIWLAVFVSSLWWVNQLHAWPYGGSPANISALRYCEPFFADLLMLTVSVLVETRLRLADAANS